MPPFLSTTKALRSLVSRSNGLRQLVSACRSNIQFSQPDQSRCFSAIVGAENGSINKSFGYRSNSKHFPESLFNSNNILQTRQFLGCGDGEEGVLSKIYEEKRVLGYSQEQLFDVVAAVDLYHGFVPWCLRFEVASMFFKEVASRMVGSFTERCRLIYGPEVPILENSFGERT